MLDGEADRLRLEHDRAAKFAWHTAFMSAYAPSKSKDFWRLKSLLWRDKPQKRKIDTWRDKFAAMSSWVSSFKKT
ncbi:hypothetical protein [Shinella sp. BYT-45]|uniref:hypothetical protein n=1 Tax=Shinella sp. BYT-45 TaxID=3377377 RepID=UPI00397EC4E5